VIQIPVTTYHTTSKISIDRKGFTLTPLLSLCSVKVTNFPWKSIIITPTSIGALLISVDEMKSVKGERNMNQFARQEVITNAPSNSEQQALKNYYILFFGIGEKFRNPTSFV
jgi:hypothetical protein